MGKKSKPASPFEPKTTNFMGLNSAAALPPQNSLFSSTPKNSGKDKTLYFFLPGTPDLYIHPIIKNDDLQKPARVWPIDDRACRTNPTAGITAAINDTVKGIPAGAFFDNEADAYKAAAKIFKIPVCIVKITMPEKMFGNVLKTADKKSLKVFDFSIMPFVNSITSYPSPNYAPRNSQDKTKVYEKVKDKQNFKFNEITPPTITPRK